MAGDLPYSGVKVLSRLRFLAAASAAAAIAAGGPLAGAASATATPSTSQNCTRQINSFLSGAAAGTWTSSMQTVALTVPVSINNPTASGSKTTPQTVSVSFTAYDETGNPISASPARPLHVSIYSQPGSISADGQPLKGSDPYSLKVTSGSSFSFKYNGRYLNRPPTITAWLPLASNNQCTGTRNASIGSAVVPLANTPKTMGNISYVTPTNCKTGTGTTCAAANVLTNGLSINAAIGYGNPLPGISTSRTTPPSGSFDSFELDTGSIGTVTPLADLGPNVIGPGAPAWKYYDSSGFEFAGYTYLAPVTFSMKGFKPTSNPIRVLAVVASNCAPDKPCTSQPQFADFHYMGVGIDREGNTAADPFTSPGDNALLSVRSFNSNPMSPGYVLSGGSVRVGLTSTTGSHFRKQQLSPNATNPGDWNAAAGCVAFPVAGAPATAPLCGSLLMDIGIQQMYISVKPGNMPAAVSGGLNPTQEIQISSPSPTSPGLTYSFTAGQRNNDGHITPPQTGQAPAFVSLFNSSTDSSGQSFSGNVEINTGRYVLFGSDYLLNAQKGQVGFRKLANPLR